MEFSCDTCGVLDHAIYDGYNVGDTLLEGVKFEIRPDGDRFTAEAKAEHAKYMKDLSAAWPARVAKAVESEDTLECPQCGGDIDGPAAG